MFFVVKESNTVTTELFDKITLVMREIRQTPPLQIELATGGISTVVYRVTYPGETLYLRLLRDPAESFAAEVAVHTHLQRHQVRVPEVVHFEEQNPILRRSVMVTTAIRGTPVSQSASLGESTLREIVTEAGRDLARINRILVIGFGRLRGHGTPDTLAGPYQRYDAAFLTHWAHTIDTLTRVLPAAEAQRLAQFYAQAKAESEQFQGRLVHGDCSTRHIFQEYGRYTGIIDFGDSMGASSWYDLGYFHMRDGGLLPYRLEPALLAGYASVTPLPPDAEAQIRTASVLIAAQMLAAALRRGALDIPAERQLRRLREDLTL